MQGTPEAKFELRFGVPSEGHLSEHPDPADNCYKYELVFIVDPTLRIRRVGP